MLCDRFSNIQHVYSATGHSCNGKSIGHQIWSAFTRHITLNTKICSIGTLVSEPDPSCGGGGKGLGICLHSSCPHGM